MKRKEAVVPVLIWMDGGLSLWGEKFLLEEFCTFFSFQTPWGQGRLGSGVRKGHAPGPQPGLTRCLERTSLTLRLMDWQNAGR